MTQPASDDLLYRRPISLWWWTKKRTYFVFVMRELSSIFIAWFVAYLLLLVYAVGRGAAAYQQFSACINCMLCYSACPVYGLDPEFIGPAAIALAERYDLDSRDIGNPQRLDVLIEHDGIWGCTFVGECTKVCPKHVDPAAAIQRYKLQSALDWVKGVILPRAAS